MHANLVRRCSYGEARRLVNSETLHFDDCCSVSRDMHPAQGNTCVLHTIAMPYVPLARPHILTAALQGLQAFGTDGVVTGGV